MNDDLMHESYKDIPQETSELYKKHYVALPVETVDSSLEKENDLDLAKFARDRLADVKIAFDAIIGSTGAIVNNPAISVSKAEDRGTRGPPSDRFEETVAETATSEIVVRVANNSRKSLNLLFVNSSRGLAARVKIVAGNGAALSLLEWYSSAGDSPSFSGVVHRIEALDDSNIEINALHSEGRSTVSASYFSNNIGAGSSLMVNGVYVGGSHTRVRNAFDASSRGCTVEANEVVLGSEEQKFDLMSKISNIGTNTNAQLNSSAAMDGASYCYLKGYAKIYHGAKLAVSNIPQEGLLLSGSSKVIALPDMSIDESDVKAAHAASAGPLDEDKLFYMMSRGIDGSISKGLITEAFLTKVISRIRSPVARELAMSMVSKKIDDGGFGGLPEIRSMGVWDTKHADGTAKMNRNEQ